MKYTQQECQINLGMKREGDMPNPSKIKGSEFERKVVRMLTANGYEAKKVPLSGAAEGYKADIDINYLGVIRKVECKKRKSGFKQIYDWLADNYALVIEQDRQEPLIIIRLKDY